MPSMADERDVLLAGSLNERRYYRQFTDRQIITPASEARLLGRDVRFAYCTPNLNLHRDSWKLLDTVRHSMLRLRSDLSLDARIKPVAHWEQDAWSDYVAMKRAELNLIEREYARRFGADV